MNEDKTILCEDWNDLPDSELENSVRQELEKDRPDGNAVRKVNEILRQRDSVNLRELPAPFLEEWETKYKEPETECDVYGKTSRFLWLGRILSVAAVLCVVIFAVPLAFGAQNIVELIARWTDDEFEFISPGEATVAQVEYIFETGHPGLQEIYDTVTGLGVTVPVVPTWVPEGYDLVELTTVEEFKGKKVYARLDCGQESIIILYHIYSDDASSPRVQKNDSQVKVVEIEGVQHVVVNNVEEMVFSWTNDVVRCVITTNLEEGTTTDIGNSIYMKG